MRIKKTKHTIKLYFQPPFYKDPDYLNALINIIKPKLIDIDYLLFSYHGLPYRHLKKTDPTQNHCLSNNCCKTPSKAWETCYQHHTIETTEKIVKQLKIHKDNYGIAYQSRLGNDPWLLPNTEEFVKKLCENGVKKLGIVCPSFVTDCLETLEEINMGIRELFLENGGESFTYIDCLNTDPDWINTLKKWVEKVYLPL